MLKGSSREAPGGSQGKLEGGLRAETSKSAQRKLLGGGLKGCPEREA